MTKGEGSSQVSEHTFKVLCTSENISCRAWISFKALVVVVGGWNKEIIFRMSLTALGSSTLGPSLTCICRTSVDITQFEAFDVNRLLKTKPVAHKKLWNWDITVSIYILLLFVRQILLTDGYLTPLHTPLFCLFSILYRLTSVSEIKCRPITWANLGVDQLKGRSSHPSKTCMNKFCVA